MLLTSILAIAAVAMITMPLRSSAYDGAKGGAQQLTVAPIVSTAVVADAAMSCPKCKDKAISYNASGKASVQDIRTVSVHACGGCSSTIGTTGVGKAKVATAEHACTLEKASCCN